MKHYLLFILLWPHLALSQVYQLKDYGLTEGLPHQTVMGVFEDNLGYLWMATRGGGIVRYDGREFKLYAVEDGMGGSNAYYVWMFSNESIWTSHDYGLSKFNGRTFTHFYHPDSLSESRKISR
ncbi:MAG TPA: hypothetical protein PKC24_16645, partial [Cyclobacteriaceae bacterium]|nr:hypothetical protein [Cyclobacteriaceae bacterium]